MAEIITDRTQQREAEAYIYETHVTAIWNTINFLGKGMAFYLAINAAVFGYVLSTRLQPWAHQKVLLIGLLTSILFAICSGMCTWWCRHMGRTIKRAIQERDPDVYQAFEIEKNFQNGQALFLTFAICLLVLVGAITAAYVYLLILGPHVINTPPAG